MNKEALPQIPFHKPEVRGTPVVSQRSKLARPIGAAMAVIVGIGIPAVAKGIERQSHTLHLQEAHDTLSAFQHRNVSVASPLQNKLQSPRQTQETSRSLERKDITQLLATGTISTPRQLVRNTPGLSSGLKAYRFNPQQQRWLNARSECESGSNPTENTGNGYYGEFQFDRESYLEVPRIIRDNTQRADQATVVQQEEAIAWLSDHEGGNHNAEPACDAQANDGELLPDNQQFFDFFGLQQ